MLWRDDGRLCPFSTAILIEIVTRINLCAHIGQQCRQVRYRCTAYRIGYLTSSDHHHNSNGSNTTECYSANDYLFEDFGVACKLVRVLSKQMSSTITNVISVQWLVWIVRWWMVRVSSSIICNVLVCDVFWWGCWWTGQEWCGGWWRVSSFNVLVCCRIACFGHTYDLEWNSVSTDERRGSWIHFNLGGYDDLIDLPQCCSSYVARLGMLAMFYLMEDEHEWSISSLLHGWPIHRMAKRVKHLCSNKSRVIQNVKFMMWAKIMHCVSSHWGSGLQWGDKVWLFMHASMSNMLWNGICDEDSLPSATMISYFFDLKRMKLSSSWQWMDNEHAANHVGG